MKIKYVVRSKFISGYLISCSSTFQKFTFVYCPELDGPLDKYKDNPNIKIEPFFKFKEDDT